MVVLDLTMLTYPQATHSKMLLTAQVTSNRENSKWNCSCTQSLRWKNKMKKIVIRKHEDAYWKKENKDKNTLKTVNEW